MDKLVHVLVEIIDVVTISIIFYSFAYAIISYVGFHTHKWFKRPKRAQNFNKIRLQLGEHLLFALEIFICADIILSVKEPTVEHLTQLGIIVIIRIIIAYFLQREINELHLDRRIHISHEEEKDDARDD